MMLIVYGRFAEVPDKMANFYKRAFETLFSEHDTSKGGYKRKSHCDLPMEDFERVFAAFCAGTYVANETKFKAAGIKEYIGKACLLEGLECDEGDLLNDMMQSVCVIQQEGDDYVFVHRSFQEYFSAVFFCNGQLREEQRRKILLRIAGRSVSDNVFNLMREIDPGKLETLWMKAACDEFFDGLGLKPSDAYPGVGMMLRQLFQYLSLAESGGGLAIRDGEFAQHFWLISLLDAAARGKRTSNLLADDLLTDFMRLKVPILTEAAVQGTKVSRKKDARRKEGGTLYHLDFRKHSSGYYFLEATTVGKKLRRSFQVIVKYDARLARLAKERDKQRDDLIFG
jgi:hypothetical protein